MNDSATKSAEGGRFLNHLRSSASSFLVLSVLIAGVELCVVMSVYDFPIFGYARLLFTLAFSILEYFGTLMLLSVALIVAGTLLAPLAFLRRFEAQLGVTFAMLFFFVSNFYLQQYVLPQDPILAPRSLITMFGTLVVAALLAYLLARVASRFHLRVRRSVLLASCILAVAGAVILQFYLEERASTPHATAGSSRPNILFITIDTLRADRLGAYGYERIETPAIDALAADGVRFETCLTSVPLTLPSHSSIFTGRYPPALTTRVNGDVLPRTETTLAELLQEEGYRTAAVIGTVVLDTRTGLRQGIHDYYDRMHAAHGYLLRVILSRIKLLLVGYLKTTILEAGGAETSTQKTADRVTREALGWFEKHASYPYFLWVHYFDPHTPYAPPKPYSDMYESKYDGEVAFVDTQIAKLLQGIEETVGTENLLIVLTADHGEGLEDHGYRKHRQRIYEEQLHVPLILAGFGPFRKPLEVEGPVRTIDIMPSLIELLDLPAPEGLHGKSTLELLQGGASARSTYIETLDAGTPSRQLFGLRESRWKLIRSRDASSRELYDLETDPDELENLWSKENDLGRRMESSLMGLMEDLNLSIEAERSQADPWHREMLKSLGYVN